MLPIGAAFQAMVVASSAAAQLAANQAKERQRLGLPEPTPPSPEEIAARLKESRRGENLMIGLLLFEAVVFAVLIVGPFAILLYAIAKAHGMK